MTGTEIAFLTARYDEIEAKVLEVPHDLKPGEPWEARPYVDMDYYAELGLGMVVGVQWPDSVHEEPVFLQPVAEHIALHDPAYVLADIAAKREIVAGCDANLYETAALIEDTAGEEWGHVTDDHTFLSRAQFLAHRRILRTLASVFADHEDFRPEWRPEGAGGRMTG